MLGELQHLITRTSLPCLSRSSDTAPGLSERRPSPSPDRVRRCLGLWDRGVAVPMVDPDVALTPEVGIEDVAVAMVPPPGAKLPVPGTVQHVEELRVLHANHGEEVLVPEVTPEVVLVGQLLHLCWLQQAAVQWGLAHGLQVEQHHPAVEAGEPLRGRAPDPGLGVLMTELPECVPGKGKENRFSLTCVCVGTVCQSCSSGSSQPPRREVPFSLVLQRRGLRHSEAQNLYHTASKRQSRSESPKSKPHVLPTTLRMTSSSPSITSVQTS